MSFLDAAAVLQMQRVPSLVGLDVHVWALDLQADSAVLSDCERLLSPRELAQAERFVFDTDRFSYRVAHAALRRLLALYGADAALEFECSAAGKPFLAQGSLYFNLSHSHGRALIGFCRERDIGVDLEMERPTDIFEIADNYFFGPEIVAIHAAQSPRVEFFRYWVCKEAVLKGEGIGLGLELDQFAVQIQSGGMSAHVYSRDLSRLAADWRVRVLDLGAGWPGAVAMRGQIPEVQVFSG